MSCPLWCAEDDAVAVASQRSHSAGTMHANLRLELRCSVHNEILLRNNPKIDFGVEEYEHLCRAYRE